MSPWCGVPTVGGYLVARQLVGPRKDTPTRASHDMPCPTRKVWELKHIADAGVRTDYTRVAWDRSPRYSH